MTSSRPGNRPKMDLDLPVLTMPSSSIGTLAKTLSARMGRRILPMIAMAAVLAMTVVHAGAARVNFAKYQAVTASGQFSTYGPDFAVEGIASNFHSFRTNNTSNPQWLEVRFPRAVDRRNSNSNIMTEATGWTSRGPWSRVCERCVPLAVPCERSGRYPRRSATGPPPRISPGSANCWSFRRAPAGIRWASAATMASAS